MDAGEDDELEGGVSGGAESRPEVRVVASELLAEEDGGHGTHLRVDEDCSS